MRNNPSNVRNNLTFPRQSHVQPDSPSQSGAYAAAILGACFLLAGVFAYLSGAPEIGKVIVSIGGMLLCVLYPPSTLFVYVLGYNTLIEMSQNPFGHGDMVFGAIILLNLLIHGTRGRTLSIPRGIWIAYFIYIVVILKGIAFPTVWSEMPGIDLMGVLIFGLAVFQMKTAKDRQIVAAAFVASSAVLAIWTVLRLRNGHIAVAQGFDVRGFGRGDQFDPNQISSFIGFGMVTVFSWILERRHTIRKLVFLIPTLVYLLICVWALALLASRGTGIVPIFATLVVLIFVQIRRPITSGMILLLLGAFAWQISSLPVFSLIFDRFGQSNKIASGNGRTVIWLLGLDHFWNSSLVELLFGSGGSASLKVAGIIMHNQFIEVLVDYGIVGLAAYLYMWYAIGKIVWDKRNPTRGAGIGLFIYLFMVCTNLVPFSYFWASWGWLLFALLATHEPFQQLQQAAPSRPRRFSINATAQK